MTSSGWAQCRFNSTWFAAGRILACSPTVIEQINSCSVQAPRNEAREEAGRTVSSNFLTLPIVKFETPMCLTLPCSTSFSISRHVGVTSRVRSQSMLGLPSGVLPSAKATGQLGRRRIVSRRCGTSGEI